MMAAMGLMMSGIDNPVYGIPKPKIKYKERPKLESVEKRKEMFLKSLADLNERCKNQTEFEVQSFAIKATNIKRANMKINSLMRQFYLTKEDFNEPTQIVR